MKVPEDIKERLVGLSKKHGVELKKVLTDYLEKFKSDFVQKDPQFKSDEDRHEYTFRVVWVRYNAAQPTQTVKVIPVGHKGKRIAKSSGVPYDDIFVLEVVGEKFELNKIVCKAEFADLPMEVDYFNLYEVEVSKATVLFAGTRTIFKDPQPVPKDPAKMLKKYGGVKHIKIKDTPDSLSAENSDGYTDDFDLFMIKGIVINYNKGDNPDGTSWGVYNISDESVGTEELTDEGKVIPSTLSVWLPQEMVKWTRDSEIVVVGTTSLDNHDTPRMNGICVIPIHPIPISEVPEE